MTGNIPTTPRLAKTDAIDTIRNLICWPSDPIQDSNLSQEDNTHLLTLHLTPSLELDDDDISSIANSGDYSVAMLDSRGERTEIVLEL